MAARRSLIVPFLTITTAVVVAFILTNTILSDFSPQVGAILLLVFICKSHWFPSRWFDVFLLLLTTIILVTITGGINSPLFFLLYLLLFGLSLIEEPLTSLYLTILLIPYFTLPKFIFTLQSTPLSDFVLLLSLPFITPVAVYFGILRDKARRQEEQIASLEDSKIDMLLWLTTSFDSHLKSLKQAVGSFNFTVEQRLHETRDWKIIKEQVKRLEKVGEKMKEYIETHG